jgi:ribonuclease-3
MSDETQLSANEPALLAAQLGITFDDPGLLRRALTHRSFVYAHPEHAEDALSNERLEFLGDAVLNLLAASWLYQRFPERSEGELTTLRAALVKAATLARFARELRLGQHVRISRGEDSQHARERTALLSDVFEAVLGAIYIDQGIEAARVFLAPFLEQEGERLAAGRLESDYRTRLQELIQAQRGITPTYRTVGVSGPGHCQEFTTEVLVGEERLGTGTGLSKQRAAQQAARAALEALGGESHPQTETE